MRPTIHYVLSKMYFSFNSSNDLDSLAFRIQNTIYLKGIKPTEFYSKPFEKEFQKLPQELVEAYALDVEQFLEFLTKK